VSRHAGVILPLFSAASTHSWGIGELADLDPLGRWLQAAGFDRLMFLPLGTMVPGGSSPYSAASAMAIDPIYIALHDLEDYARAGSGAALSAEGSNALYAARRSARVAYPLVRRAKSEALDLAFTSFVHDEWQSMTGRAAALAGYIARERWWLDDYALFQAIAGAAGTGDWLAWPPPLREREPGALDEARQYFAREVLRHQYLQWIAETQWQTARAAARARGVRVVGDLPFVVATDSADVWMRPREFMLDVSAGVPPDAFSDTGQDWALPTYRWDAIAATNFAWMRQRALRMAALYDSVRIDHLVGFYRTFGRTPEGHAFFNPGDEATQTWQGEQILRIFLESGAEVLVEDLGTVPDFVRASMARMGVPGHKVLRWERHYHAPDRPFVDPATFPAMSVALTGTHDTETLASWWDNAAEDERRAFLRLGSSRHAAVRDATAPWSDPLRDQILELAYRAGSDHLFLPLQDLFGWRDRINTPATITDDNWTWRVPWPVDTLVETAAAVERAGFCRQQAMASDRV